MTFVFNNLDVILDLLTETGDLLFDIVIPSCKSVASCKWCGFSSNLVVRLNFCVQMVTVRRVRVFTDEISACHWMPLTHCSF